MTTLCERIRQGAGRPSAGICTVALSGGADSTALLCCLHAMKAELSLDLRAVHIHHGMPYFAQSDAQNAASRSASAPRIP